MTEETEIYKEWYELYFREPPSPHEYMYYRETLDFKKYLLRYRGKELAKTIREKVLLRK